MCVLIHYRYKPLNAMKIDTQAEKTAKDVQLSDNWLFRLCMINSGIVSKMKAFVLCFCV